MEIGPGPVTEGLNHAEMHLDMEKGRTAAPKVSQFNALVLTLGFVCIGLLVAVVTMAAVISNDNGGGDAGTVTVVCPTGGVAAAAVVTPTASGSASPAASVPVTSPTSMMTTSPTPAVSTIPVVCTNPETMYWEFPAEVFQGYKGCVSQVGMIPCAQDGFEGMSGMLALNKSVVYNEATSVCEATEFDATTMTYWVLWGLPMDARELSKRTGSTPSVSFPFDRATYPSYAWGDHDDDSLSAQAKVKEFLQYIDGFTKTELDTFDVSITEGAESGMIILWGAVGLTIARTTCNRQLYVLNEVPSYGYDNTQAASYANDHASSFYNGSECTCYATDSCRSPTVRMTTVGWVPGTALPIRNDHAGVPFAANSASSTSPWFESMVFPENPTGTLKVAQLPNADRRVCDGVYLYPMYFGPDWVVSDKRPDCSFWSFSITKAYSASVRAGSVMYKTNAAIKTAVETIVEDVHSMANGLLSEWTWRGQVQLYDMMMEKPFTDPTSWVGAYKTIIDEKWKFVIDGFANCPAVEITNDYKGGYVYFKKKLGYLGLEDGFVTHFFLETMGVKATTYNWGWRGANPADMYPGLNTYDFIRLHLYRDISVYEEIGRRAKIMCGGGKVADHMLTMEEWKAAHTVTANSRRRKLLSTEETHSDTQRRLSETVPRLTAAQVQYHVKNHQEAIGINNNIEKYCAPNGYTTSCMMKYSSSKYIETKDTPMML